MELDVQGRVCWGEHSGALSATECSGKSPKDNYTSTICHFTLIYRYIDSRRIEVPLYSTYPLRRWSEDFWTCNDKKLRYWFWEQDYQSYGQRPKRKNCSNNCLYTKTNIEVHWPSAYQDLPEGFPLFIRKPRWWALLYKQCPAVHEAATGEIRAWSEIFSSRT